MTTHDALELIHLHDQQQAAKVRMGVLLSALEVIQGEVEKVMHNAGERNRRIEDLLAKGD